MGRENKNGIIEHPEKTTLHLNKELECRDIKSRVTSLFYNYKKINVKKRRRGALEEKLAGGISGSPSGFCFYSNIGMAGNDFLSYIEEFVDILKDGSGRLLPLFFKGKLLMAFEEMMFGLPKIL